MSKTYNLKHIIERDQEAKTLTNTEVMVLAEGMGKISDALCNAGPTFRCAFHEANRILMKAADWAHAREIIDITYETAAYTKWLDKKGVKRS